MEDAGDALLAPALGEPVAEVPVVVSVADGVAPLAPVMPLVPLVPDVPLTSEAVLVVPAAGLPVPMEAAPAPVAVSLVPEVVVPGTVAVDGVEEGVAPMTPEAPEVPVAPVEPDMVVPWAWATFAIAIKEDAIRIFCNSVDILESFQKRVAWRLLSPR